MMNELMRVGVELMLIGMGIVFTFLALLVVAVIGMAWVIQRWFPEPTATSSQVSTAHRDEIVVAITAAVHLYRARNLPGSQ